MTYEELLSDALDHIARIAAMARTPTKRLDWIVQRALTAIEGGRWDDSYAPQPKARKHDETCAYRKDAGRYRKLRYYMRPIDAAKILKLGHLVDKPGPYAPERWVDELVDKRIEEDRNNLNEQQNQQAQQAADDTTQQ